MVLRVKGTAVSLSQLLSLKEGVSRAGAGSRAHMVQQSLGYTVQENLI